MPDIPLISDAFEYKNAGDNWPGAWANVTSGASATSDLPYQIVVGERFGRHYRAILRYGPIDVERGESIGKFNMRFFPPNMFGNVRMNIRCCLDPDVVISSSNRFTSNAVTRNKIRDTSRDANYNANGEWETEFGVVVTGIPALAQEVVNHPNWAPGKSITVLVDFVDNNTNGTMRFYAQEHPTLLGSNAFLQTTLDVTGGIFIDRVNGGNIIYANDKIVSIDGSGYISEQEIKVRIYKGTLSVNQPIASITDTNIKINYTQNLPVGGGYTLEVLVDQIATAFPVSIVEAITQGAPTLEGTVNTQLDGFEWTPKADGFPGTWADVTNSASETQFFANQIIVGEWGSPLKAYQAIVKLGPLNIERGARLSVMDLIFNVARNYKFCLLNIRAIADPSAANVTLGNLPSDQNMTTAVASENTANWTGASATAYWTPATNPRPISVIGPGQEVINHPNWTPDSSIQFIINYTPLSSAQGFFGFFAAESITNPATRLYYKVGVGPAITSVSNDNILEKGEVGISIIGVNLSGATNLRIINTTLGINVLQTILSASNTNILFDMTTGNIVAGDGYVLSFVVNGQTISIPITITEGGGVNAGNAPTESNGYEKDDAFPVLAGTFFENSATDINVNYFDTASIFCGAWDSSYYDAAIRFGPIAAVRGQSFTQADLVLNLGRCYKTIDIDVFAIADPLQVVGADNLISAQTLTTATHLIQTASWTGASGTDYWFPDPQTIDVSALVTEAVASANWQQYGYVTIVFKHRSTFGNSGFVSFFGKGHPTEDAPELIYETGSARNISNVNGTNAIRHLQTNVEIRGSEMANARSIRITQGSLYQDQVIKTNTSELATFDFNRGNLGYGPAVLSITYDDTTTSINITLLPRTGWTYKVLEALTTGNNSLIFEALPAFTLPDIIAHQANSANGFKVVVDGTGVPEIHGGTLRDSFQVEAWKASNGIWSNVETVVFNGADYLSRTIVPLTGYKYELSNEGFFDLIAVVPPPIDPDPVDPTDPTDPTDPDNGGGDNGGNPDPDPTPDPEPNPGDGDGGNSGGDGTDGGDDNESGPDDGGGVVIIDIPEGAPELWVIQDDKDNGEVWQ